MRTNIILQFRVPLENDYQSGSREQVRVSYRFRIFESRPRGVVGFGRYKVRCGRMVHSDSDTR